MAFAISTGLHSNPQKTKRPEPRITMSLASAKQAPVKADASQLLLSRFLQDRYIPFLDTIIDLIVHYTKQIICSGSIKEVDVKTGLEQFSSILKTEHPLCFTFGNTMHVYYKDAEIIEKGVSAVDNHFSTDFFKNKIPLPSKRYASFAIGLHADVIKILQEESEKPDATCEKLYSIWCKDIKPFGAVQVTSNNCDGEIFILEPSEFAMLFAKELSCRYLLWRRGTATCINTRSKKRTFSTVVGGDE